VLREINDIADQFLAAAEMDKHPAGIHKIVIVLASKPSAHRRAVTYTGRTDGAAACRQD